MADFIGDSTVLPVERADGPTIAAISILTIVVSTPLLALARRSGRLRDG